MSEETTENQVETEVQPEAPAEITPEQGIEDLRKQLEAEKQARQAEAAARITAEKQAREAYERARAASTEVQDNNLTLVNNAIGMVDRDIQIYRDNLKAALEAQDYEAATEATEGLSDSKAKRLQLINGKEEMERRAKEPPPQAPQPRSVDPVEALAAQLTPRSANWVRANPQFATDPRLYQKMIAAHNLVVSDGVQPDTDDYFTEIENILKVRPTEPQKEAPRAPPAAPPSRSTGNVVRLSADEREMAAMMGMTDQEYLNNKRELQKAGRLH